MITRKALTVADFTQEDNVTSPAILTPVLSYTVPRGMLLFVDPSQPVYANVMAYELYTLEAGDIDGNTVTIPLSHKVASVPSDVHNIIAVYDPSSTNEKVYGELDATDPTKKTIKATFTATPSADDTVAVYYSIQDAHYELSISAPSVNSVTVRTLLAGTLGVLNATDPTNINTMKRAMIRRIVPAIEDYEIQLRVKSDVSIKFTMPESFFELPVVMYTFNEAYNILRSQFGITATDENMVKQLVDRYFRSS